MADVVLYERKGDVAVLTLNQPETMNAISGYETIDAIVGAIGKAFSSGGNMKDMENERGIFGGTPYQIRQGYMKGIQQIPLAMYALDVPIIAAVNGPAVGAGCDFTCMCDIRIAGRSARFSEAFVRLGIVPGDGGAWFLPRVVGMSKASEMAFTGEFVGAEEALACGLVSKVVDDDKLMDEALALAGRIAVNPPHALRMAKRLIREGQRTELATLLEMSASLQALAHKTEDHKEAVAAFVQKRKPSYKGR